jgi:ribosomal protein S20
VFRSRVDDSIRALEHSALAPVYVARGVNLREAINKVFESDIRASWQAYFETNGAYPRGLEKQKLVDRALDAANAQVDRMMNPKGLKANTAAPAAPTQPATPGATVRPGVKELN